MKNDWRVEPLKTAQRLCRVIDLGCMEYHAAWDVQRRLAALRAENRIVDTLLLVEHPHTYTLGRSGKVEHLLMGEAERAEKGVLVVEVDRGGDITYHGPGQLVAYPILYLGRADARGHLPTADYVGYLRRLEEVLIRTVAGFGIEARREEGYTGVWVDRPGGPEKIAAIGVRVSAGGVSTHGVALNVAPDLAYFRGIIPCGIADRPVTSMQALLGSAPPMSDVRAVFTAAFAGVFGCRLAPATLGDLLPDSEKAPG
ncbi:MAG TPA: lipoyl(octanoyl) transferase LipB [Aggregatilineales bacterium]|nr:lipoyl(octanoyl) transferase LipB [Aggregatilineales bacterium]